MGDIRSRNKFALDTIRTPGSLMDIVHEIDNFPPRKVTASERERPKSRAATLPRPIPAQDRRISDAGLAAASSIDYPSSAWPSSRTRRAARWFLPGISCAGQNRVCELTHSDRTPLPLLHREPRGRREAVVACKEVKIGGPAGSRWYSVCPRNMILKNGKLVSEKKIACTV